MIGKGEVRSYRVSFYTLTVVKCFGMVFFHSRACTKCKTVKTIIGREM